MDIFKDKDHEAGFHRLDKDYQHIMVAFAGCETRLVENTLSDLMDRLHDEARDTLTDEAQAKFELQESDGDDLDIFDYINQLLGEKPNEDLG